MEKTTGQVTTPEDLEAEEANQIQYKVDDVPAWYLCLFLGFQHYLTMFCATLTVPLMLAPDICIGEDNVGKSEIIGTLFFVSGIITLLQNALGIRLAIVQAGTFALLAPTLSYLRLPKWKCPTILPEGTNLTNYNGSYAVVNGSPEHREEWQKRLREIQGAIMIAAVFEIFLGCSGIVGFLLRYIGPLSICPTISLLGLSLFKSAAEFAAVHWWIALVTMLLMVIFSQYLGSINIPCFIFDKMKGCHRVNYPFFKLFPVILAISISWIICAILTATNVLPQDPGGWGYKARTDIRTDVLVKAPWIRIPYPFQWGMPTVSISAVLGILAGILATTVESVGDYHACARLSGAPPPPKHAINRGIFIEGLGSFLDGVFGTGNGTTSTSINVGVVGITKCGSRRVVMVAAGFMMVLGALNKFGALFVTIPDPVIGASFFILFGMIVAVGISNLHHVDLNSSRNLFVFGFAFFFGLSVPQWVSSHPGYIKTGVVVVDNIFQVLLSTSMFVGGVIGFILDNTVPGTMKERGLASWRQEEEVDKEDVDQQRYTEQRMAECYDLPIGMSYIKKWNFTRYIPFSPTYGMRKKVRHMVDQESPVANGFENDITVSLDTFKGKDSYGNSSL